MLIATATLITILFLGAGIELYFIESLEKGVKKEVVDKTRKKEINAALSAYKKNVKTFNKVRNSYLKDLESLTQDQYASAEDFQLWYEGLDSLTKNHHQYAFDTRMSVSQLLSDAEWDKIVFREKSRMMKDFEKKADKKVKDPLNKVFARLEQFIDESDMHEMDRIEAKQKLDSFQAELRQLNSFYKDVQLEFSSVIFEQHCSEEEFLKIFEKHDEISTNSYNSLIDMHYAMSNNLSEKEWNKFIGQIRKKV